MEEKQAQDQRFAELKNQVKALEEVLDVHVDQENPEEIIEHGVHLKTLMSNAGVAHAQIKALYAKVFSEQLVANMENAKTATLVKMIAEGSKPVRDVAQWLHRAERAEKNVAHQLDWLRSVLSYRKQEAYYTQQNDN